jgi:hypothetical protein
MPPRADAVAIVECERAIERIRVFHFHPDVLVLIAELDGVLALDPGVVDLGIEN